MFFCSSCTIFLTQITNVFKIGRINKSFDVTLVLSFHWSRDDLLNNFQWNTTSFRTSDIWHFACLTLTFLVLKTWEDISPFLGWLKPLFLSSGDVCPGFQSQGALPHLHVCHPHATESSDSPLVWHLLKSWQPALQLSHSHPHTCKQVLVGLETRIYFACCCLTLWDQADALLTELCWLGFLVLKLDLDIVCNSMQKTWST